MTTALYTTVDFYDDLIHTGRFFGPADIDAMMRALAALGIRRVNWIVDTLWPDLYELPVGGHRNVLYAAVDAAHRHGMELHGLIKPFERCFSGPRTLFPHTFPEPEDGGFLDDPRGLVISVDPFVLKHPDLRMRRRPGDEDPGTAIRQVRLVKADASGTRVRKEHLSVWGSDKNGELHPYRHDFDFAESIEWREDFYPPRGKRRVLTLGKLQIPTEWQYIFVKCSLTDGEADFGNTPLELMELYDGEGRRLLVTPAESKVGPEAVRLEFPEAEITPYGRSPEVREFFADPERVRAAVRDFYIYDRSSCNPYRGGLLYLDRRGFAGVMRGKNPWLLGTVSPLYPEVRAFWLDLVRRCLDAGVDGMNLRHANHGTKSHEREEYGFNDPVMAEARGRVDRDLAHRMNGEAYTQFLREAKELCAKRGLPLTLHVSAGFFYRDDRPYRTSDNQPPAPNLSFEWEKWIREGIADQVELKGGGMKKANADHFVDAVTRVAGECGTPVVTCGFRHFGYDSPNSVIEEETRRLLADPRISAYDLYEVAGYTRLLPDGTFEVEPRVAALLREAGFARKRDRAGERRDSKGHGKQG